MPLVIVILFAFPLSCSLLRRASLHLVFFSPTRSTLYHHISFPDFGISSFFSSLSLSLCPYKLFLFILFILFFSAPSFEVSKSSVVTAQNGVENTVLRKLTSGNSSEEEKKIQKKNIEKLSNGRKKIIDYNAKKRGEKDKIGKEKRKIIRKHHPTK